MNFLLHGEKFLGTGNFLWGEFLEEILHRGNLPEFLYKFLLMSCFLFANSILRIKMLMVTVQGKFLPGLNFLEDMSRGKGDFPLR